MCAENFGVENGICKCKGVFSLDGRSCIRECGLNEIISDNQCICKDGFSKVGNQCLCTSVLSLDGNQCL